MPPNQGMQRYIFYNNKLLIEVKKNNTHICNKLNGRNTIK